MRKPFDVLAEGLVSENSRGERIFTEPKIEFTGEDYWAA
jgi:hypothetical protein